MRALALGILDALAPLLARVLPLYVREPFRARYFPLWERHGFRVSPVHFYEPVPDTRRLLETFWERESELVGVDVREAEQLWLLRDGPLPRGVRRNPAGASRPPRPIPPGERLLHRGRRAGLLGHGAPLSAAPDRRGRCRLLLTPRREALLRNGSGELTCIEPHPDPVLRTLPGTTLVQAPVEEIPLSFFDRLRFWMRRTGMPSAPEESRDAPNGAG